MIEFNFDVSPVAKGRPKLTRFGKAYTPKKTKVFEQDVKSLAKEQYEGKPLLGPLKISIVFSITRPKSVSVKKRKYPTVRPDLDNYIKAVLDSLNGVLFHDDSQVITMTCSKQYAEESGIYVKCETLK